MAIFTDLTNTGTTLTDETQGVDQLWDFDRFWDNANYWDGPNSYFNLFTDLIQI